MALSDYGQSFSPVQKPGEGKASGRGNQTQEAIRTISTRIPRIAQGGRAIAPQPLLNAPGGAALAAPMGTLGQPNVGGLEELIRRLFGLLGGGMPAGAPAPMGGPAPMAAPPPMGAGPMPPAGGGAMSPAGVPIPTGVPLGSPQTSTPAPPANRWLPHLTPGLTAPAPHLPMPSGPLVEVPEPAPMSSGPAWPTSGPGGSSVPSQDELMRLLNSINV